MKRKVEITAAVSDPFSLENAGCVTKTTSMQSSSCDMKKELRKRVRQALRSFTSENYLSQGKDLQLHFLASETYKNSKGLGIYLPMRRADRREAPTELIVAFALLRDKKRVFVPTVSPVLSEKGPSPHENAAERNEIGFVELEQCPSSDGEVLGDDEDAARLLEAFEKTVLQHLPLSNYGIPEPPLDLRTPEGLAKNSEAVATMDVIIVPGVAFSTRTGGRIGQGAGFYDRFVATHYNYKKQSDEDNRNTTRAKLIGYGLDVQMISDFPTGLEQEWDQPLDHLISPSGWLM
ncbi:unnamed protein product [Amoebophrya sp. A25]|nr:unnamed protein product [Amoebophrya sp. A25]|eukprot:GSA25T00013780001.1